MSKLSSVIEVKPRFSRSINIERDTKVSSLEGYVPTGRALDVVKRVARGLAEPMNGRAFSITGPHGGGKSSLALLLRAMTSGKNSDTYKTAIEMVTESDPRIASIWKSTYESLPQSSLGFVHALVMATREPIRKTLTRVLESTILELAMPASETSRLRKLLTEGDRGIIQVVREVSKKRGLVLIIDEFGKNIEAVADSPTEGDLFILQALAELSAGDDAIPFLLLTLQHLSFDEYIQGVGSAQKKEWAKIQGRFQDIPYIESTFQYRRLIASVFRAKNPIIAKKYKAWLSSNRNLLHKAGLAEFSEQSETRATYPLHPLVLATLPQLCSKYGQNERTLFSFLASKARNSVVEFLDETVYSSSGKLPFVGLDRVYDYFLEASSTSISSSSSANRWIEIETRIRDAQGLDGLELKLLKGIGILNLVSSGGVIRASRDVLKLAIFDEIANASPKLDSIIEKTLTKLESKGLIVYRGFADEYRIWQGSDFDLRSAMEQARRALNSRRITSILAEITTLAPLVAGRNSQQNGVLRVFEQKIFTPQTLEQDSHKYTDKQSFDGLVVYTTHLEFQYAIKSLEKYEKPCLLLVGEISPRVHDLILETASLESLIRGEMNSSLDWVAKRELIERLMFAKRELQAELDQIWLQAGRWIVPSLPTLNLDKQKGISSALSAICDSFFNKTPKIPNEMIARRELTGQGAKARRMVIESLLHNADKAHLGIEGFGPERAIYEAVLAQTGLHRQAPDGGWYLAAPKKKDWTPIWQEFERLMESAVADKRNIQDFYDRLGAAPYGLKNGIIPLLLVTFLMTNKSEIALYEHGTLLLELDEPTLERLVKNPWNFSLRNYGLSSHSRSKLLREIVDNFGISNVGTANSFVNVVKALYREVLFINEFAKRTEVLLSAPSQRVRNAFFEATEPDILLFVDLPKVLGFRPFISKQIEGDDQSEAFARKLKTCFVEIRTIQEKLLSRLVSEISAATATSNQIEKMRKQLEGQAANLDGRVIDTSLRSFVSAIQRTSLSDPEWLENLAMVALEGKPPKNWADDDLARFTLRMREIGGALNRLQALLYDRLSKRDDGFEAVRLTLTHANGSETARVLTLSERERSVLDSASEKIFKELLKSFDNEEEAKTVLLAYLAAKMGEQQQNKPNSRKREAK